MSIKVYYHAGDMDGWCSGAIVKKFYQDQEIEVEMFPINYGDKFLWEVINPDDIVYVVDFSLPEEEMIKLGNLLDDGKGELIWIDHHIGVSSLFEEVKCSGMFDTSVAACELTWKYLFDKEVPRFVELLSAYDCWDHSGRIASWGEIEHFQYGFKARATNPKDSTELFWDGWFLFSDLNREVGTYIKDTINVGAGIQKYVEDRFRSELASRSYKIYWEGHKCLVINSDPYIANFMTRCNEFADCDIAINYCNNGGKSWIVNLRTNKKGIDLSEIAKLYKGGGHCGASGFNCRELPFEVLV